MSDNSSKTAANGIFVERNFAPKSSIQGPSKSSAVSALAAANSARASGAAAAVNQPEPVGVSVKIEKASLPYFDGMMDFDEVFEQWCKKLLMFVSQPEKECQFNFWSGSSLTGKTTIAKRLAGLEGFKMFSEAGVNVQYFDCYTLKDNFEKLRTEWLDPKKTPPNTVIFIDEFEKCVDANYKLVDEVFARKLRKYFEDITRSQKLMFVFLSYQKNDRSTVVKLLDSKLTSVTDFSLCFPEWTSERLTTLILKKMHSRGVKISNMAAANLALHASQHTKYMEVQGVLPLLEAELRISGKTEVDEELMERILKGRR